jgi:hypothetical protein
LRTRRKKHRHHPFIFYFFPLISFNTFVCFACNLYLNLHQIKRYVFPLFHFILRICFSLF